MQILKVFLLKHLAKLFFKYAKLLGILILVTT